ncbi:MAG TPA: phosphatase PAP2 family protein [Gaiellaceae bacterium]|nr:phosphatase PAP2 family protein [Gaiellaceae bacterium]
METNWRLAHPAIAGNRSVRATGGNPPALEARPDGPARRLAGAFGSLHPALVFLVTMLGGFFLIIGLSICLGLLATHVLTGISGEHVDVWLSHHRTPARTDASLIGSIGAGGVVLPIVVGVVALVCLLFRKWRIAAFMVFALAVESGTYRATTLVIHSHRPRVARLEHLPVNASYPSGHTAASLAVYGGLALLLSSWFPNRWVRIVAWSLVVLIVAFVATSRMYRGMHHPIDVVGGLAVGIAALCVVVFACRTAGAAAEARS